MVDAGVDGEAERVEGETVTWLGLKPLLAGGLETSWSMTMHDATCSHSF